MIRTNDTDVVVLAVSVVSTIPVEELWVTYGSGKQLQNLAAHTIAATLGRERAFVLPMFHALTGCDTVSFFAVRGKKTAWDVWGVFLELTSTLLSLTSLPEVISDACMAVIEHFVVLLYDRTSNLTEVKPKRHSCSTPSVLYIKVGVFGPKHFLSNLYFQALLNGDGSITTIFGHWCGQLCRR